MAETKFTSYDEVLKSGLIGDVLYLVISNKGTTKTYKDLLPLDGGTVGIASFAVGGLEILYKNMNTQTYFGKTEKEMIDGYSTKCRPAGKSGDDNGWGCYSQKFWYDGMKLFLDSPDSKSIQEKAWSAKMKVDIEDVIKKGWTTKRQIAIALSISNSLGIGGMKSIADSNKWDAEKTLQSYASKSESNEKRRKLIDENFPFVKNVETTNDPNYTPTSNTPNTPANSIAENKVETPKGPDFPEDKVFTFNVENSKFLVSTEIGTFSVVPINPEFDFFTDEENIPLDDEYYEEQFAGQEEEITDLNQATIDFTTQVDNAQPSEIIDDSGVLGGSNIKVKGAKKWTSLSDAQEKSAIFLYKTALTYGFTDIEARAMLAVVSKESAFAPRNEISYRNTSVSRIREVFPSTFGSEKKKKISDAEVERIKKDDKLFWNKVYGGKYGNGPDEGWRYLGRGFNGLTFKGSDKDLSGYIGYNILYKRNGSKGGPVDIVNNPDLVNKQEGGVYKVACHLCCLYFQKNKNKYFANDANNNLDKVIFNFMRANAGWNSSTSGNIFQEGLGKARAFAASLPSKIQ